MKNQSIKVGSIVKDNADGSKYRIIADLQHCDAFMGVEITESGESKVVVHLIRNCISPVDELQSKVVNHPHIINRFAIVDPYGTFLRNPHGAVCGFKSREDAAQHLVPVQG